MILWVSVTEVFVPLDGLNHHAAYTVVHNNKQPPPHHAHNHGDLMRCTLMIADTGCKLRVYMYADINMHIHRVSIQD